MENHVCQTTSCQVVYVCLYADLSCPNLGRAGRGATPPLRSLRTRAGREKARGWLPLLGGARIMVAQTVVMGIMFYG